jgi:hypothetical protein
VKFKRRTISVVGFSESCCWPLFTDGSLESRRAIYVNAGDNVLSRIRLAGKIPTSKPDRVRIGVLLEEARAEVTGMPSTHYFEELYGVTEEGALNFWSANLHEAIGSKQWSQISGSTGVYLASVLGHFCLQSVDRMEILSPDYSPSDLEFPQFADLTQIAELMMRQLTSAKNPLWMESAGAHILLYAGFFQEQNKNRHNIEFYSTMGRECYLMAAVGKRAKTMKLMATDFNQYLFHLANLHRHLRESRYLIKTEN